MEDIKKRNYNSEEWRDVVGYEGLYQVSNLGVIRTFKYKCYPEGKQLKGTIKGGRYMVANLSKPGNSKNYYIHRIVAMAFIPNPHNFNSVNHINGINTDNRAENLEWICSHDNTQHYINLVNKLKHQNRIELFKKVTKFKKQLSAIENAMIKIEIIM